jgi:chlorite dismutase
MSSQTSPRPEKVVQPDDTLDLREFGAAINGVPQVSTRRLFLQLQVFGGCTHPQKLIEPLKASDLDVVLYQDLNAPCGIGLLFLTEQPDALVTEVRSLLTREPFASLRHRPELTMIGRTYSSGHEPNLEDWLLVKPRRNALNPDFPWAIWYPLRRKSEFYLLPEPDRRKVLFEHAMIGRSYAQAGYAYDIRLACFGLEENDNEFVIGLVGPELYPLSRLIQEMRHTQQTAKYIESLGPFFVGKVCWQSPLKA